MDEPKDDDLGFPLIRHKWARIIVGVVALVALSPVLGMLVFFAVLPSLPIALAIGIVLGPTNLVKTREIEEEEEHKRHRWLHAHA